MKLALKIGVCAFDQVIFKSIVAVGHFRAAYIVPEPSALIKPKNPPPKK